MYNLKPTEELQKALHRVEYIVEANRFERMVLWQEWSKRTNWVQDLSGFGATLGELDGRPVTVSLNFADIDGHRILFFYATSEVVDHALIQAWLSQHCPLEAIDGRPATCDANDFHMCVRACEQLNKLAG